MTRGRAGVRGWLLLGDLWERFHRRRITGSKRASAYRASSGIVSRWVIETGSLYPIFLIIMAALWRQ